MGSQLQSGQQSALEAIKRQRAGGSALDAVTIEAAKEIYEETDDEEFERRQRKSLLRQKSVSLARITEELTHQLRNPEIALSSAAHHAWEIQPTSSGSHFWRNTATGETRWTSP